MSRGGNDGEIAQTVAACIARRDPGATAHLADAPGRPIFARVSRIATARTGVSRPLLHAGTGSRSDAAAGAALRYGRSDPVLGYPRRAAWFRAECRFPRRRRAGTGADQVAERGSTAVARRFYRAGGTGL